MRLTIIKSKEIGGSINNSNIRHSLNKMYSNLPELGYHSTKTKLDNSTFEPKTFR